MKGIREIALLLFLIHAATYAQTNLPIKPDRTKPFVLGVIDELESAVLSEKRILNIYLPRGYNQEDSVKYPVIYLLDGSADEDFIHIAGLIQFNNFPWINRVPKSIVVGIANVDRKRDFTFPSSEEADRKLLPSSGHSGKFIGFLETELQPFIQANYRVGPSKMIIGQSLGGLLVTEILISKPYLFDKYIIISPSLWWDNGSPLLPDSYQRISELAVETSIYIGVGKEGPTPGKIPRLMETDAQLLAEKVRNSKNALVTVYFDFLPEENHATITHQSVFNALRLLYPVKAANQ